MLNQDTRKTLPPNHDIAFTAYNSPSRLTAPERLAASVLFFGSLPGAAATLEAHVSSSMAEPAHGGARDVTPLQLVGAGAASLSLGAMAGFSSHYLGAFRELYAPA